MILVKTQSQDQKPVYYVVSSINELYKELQLNNLAPTTVETIDCDVKVLLRQERHVDFVMNACIELNTTLEEIRSPARTKSLVENRKVITYGLRNVYKMSWHEIGDFMFRDHTTSIVSYKYVEENKDVESIKFKLQKLGLIE